MVILSALLASQLVFVAANDHHRHHQAGDPVPKFDTSPSCRANIGDGFETLDGCQHDETLARDQLGKEWSQFEQADKTLCSDMTKGYNPSYVELLSCLEMTRDAKTPPQDLNTPPPAELQTPATVGGAVDSDK